MSTPNVRSGRLHLPRLSSAPATRAVSAEGSRRRTHPFTPDPIAVTQVLQLLQAAFGATRPGNWGRAAASPLSWRELVVYAVTPQGLYRYDAPRLRVELVNPEDLRAATGHDVMAMAPLSLVYVADFDSMQQAHAEEHGVCAGADAGCVVEKVCERCAEARLGSVVHGLLDRPHLARVLGLKPTERILVVQSVGHPASEAAH